jgi:XTP/dITP diphosphohydrolase
MKLELRFVSGNKYKIQEVENILSKVGVKVISFPKKIREIQTANEKEMVRDKLLKAFKDIGRKIFVEHTGLYLESLNNLPGGLTQIFWDKLEAENFSRIFGNLDNVKLVAKTLIGYCDGRNIHYFEGEVKGIVVPTPRGNKDFQWDCIFQPDGYDKTFAELGDLKNDISMRRIALDKFAEYLKNNG